MCREHLSNRKPFLTIAAALILACCPALGHAITISWSTVGNPGNAPDPATGRQYGAVNYIYNIGTYDVTTGQYTAFLNAVAATDTYGLWNSNMATGFNGDGLSACGITQNGSSGSYTYSVSRNPNFPVNYTSFGDAARFANWLQNGQPTGPEGPGTTETGAYTLNGAVTDAALLAVTRNANATIFLPSENEWYKAAYYDGTNGTYWTYPTQNISVPSNVLSATGTNNANFHTTVYTDPANYLTPVGAFVSSPGPYGTYDMGGDMFQWNEGIVDSSSRSVRGGSYFGGSQTLESSFRGDALPSIDLDDSLGFRVAGLPVPEPATWLLATIGASGLWFARRRQRSPV